MPHAPHSKVRKMRMGDEIKMRELSIFKINNKNAN